MNLKEFYSPSLKLNQPIPREIVRGEGKTFTEVLAKVLSDRQNNLRTYFRALFEGTKTVEKGVFEIDVMKDAVEATFSKNLTSAERTIFKDALDRDNKSELEAKLLLDNLAKGMRAKEDILRLFIYYTACYLDKMQMSTEDYLYKFELFKGRYYNERAFIQPASKALFCEEFHASMIFTYLVDGADSIPADDLIDAIEYYRKNKVEAQVGPPPKEEVSTKPQVKPVTGEGRRIYPKNLSAEDRKKIFEEIGHVMKKKKITPQQIFRYADNDESGVIPVISLKNAMQAMLPEVNIDVILAVSRLADSRKNGFVSKEDFEVIMMTEAADLQNMDEEEERSDLSKSMTIPSPASGGSNQQPTGSKDGKQNPPRPGAHYDLSQGPILIKELAYYLNQKKTDAGSYFDQLDTSEKGEIAVTILNRELSQFVPEMGKPKISCLLRFVDARNSGSISRGEFMASIKYDEKFVPKAEPEGASMEPSSTIGKKPVLPGGRPALRTPSVTSNISELSMTPKSTKGGPVQPAIPSPTKPAQPAAAELLTRTPNDAEFYNLIRELRAELKIANANIAEIFAQDQFQEGADQYHKSMSTTSLANKLSQLLPGLDKQKTARILKYIDMNKTGQIGKTEFEIAIGIDTSKGELEESIMFEETRVDYSAIKAIIEMCAAKNVKPEEVFDRSDSDNNGRVNILDLKIGLERLLGSETETFFKIIHFVKEVKNVFKTANFGKKNFILFLTDPKTAKNRFDVNVSTLPLSTVSKTPAKPSTPSSKGASKPQQLPQVQGKDKIARTPAEKEFYEGIRDLRSAMSSKKIGSSQLAEIFPEGMNILPSGKPNDVRVPVTTAAHKLSEMLDGYDKKKLVQILKFVDVGKTGAVTKSEFELAVGIDPIKNEIEESYIVRL